VATSFFPISLPCRSGVDHDKSLHSDIKELGLITPDDIKKKKKKKEKA
jgi:hypothetical protein